MTLEDLTNNFNEAQREAVLYCDGPSLVIAGAGSGKTRVLTYKVAYLMQQGLKPWNILALTFTNKAANEMKQRIATIVGEDAKYLWAGTFHSVFLRILRREHELIGFSQNFTIYDASDSKSLVKSIIKEMELDDKIYKPSTIAGKISIAKNQLVDAETYYKSGIDYQQDIKEKREQTRDIFKEYSTRCKLADAMDFDDILLYTYKLFSEHPEIALKYEQQFQYVLVDEYQDTNYAQHKIVWELTQHRQKVCVVGDDAQSIYSFRGAQIDNILQFGSLYDNIKTFKLERNYRSTQTIVNAANSLIHKNRHQIFKNVYSNESEGERIPVIKVHSDTEEGGYVTRQLLMLKRTDHLLCSDFAVLYRTNAQSRIFEEAFRKLSIPYRIYGGLSFYQRKEIKDIIAYFRMAVNPKDEEALKRIINYPTRGIGLTTINKISECASNNSVSLWDVVSSPQTYNLSVNAGTLAKIANFQLLIMSFIQYADKNDAESTGRYILSESGIINDIYQDKSPENVSKQENAEELLNGLADFCKSRREEGDNHVSLSDYLSEISLMSDIDESHDDETTDEGGKVTLMTIHSAKGLEFNTVFIVGLEEGLFPNQMCNESPKELEEERRLLYVAITRAKCHCFLSYSMSRYRYGQMEFSSPSRFLSDIDSQYLIYNQEQSNKQDTEITLPWKKAIRSSQYEPQREHLIRPTQQQLNTRFKRISTTDFSNRAVSVCPQPSNSSSDEFCPQMVSEGQRIEHERFGSGTVVKVEGQDGMSKATIEFDNVGTKQLLLKYAKIRKI